MIPLLKPELPPTAKQYVNECLDTGWLSYTGPYVERLETAVNDFVGAQGAVATSSGTAALWFVLMCIGVGPGITVAVPTMTFVATVNAIRYTGADPILIGCDDNLQLSIEDLKAAAAELQIDVVLPVHMLGNTSNMEKINEVLNGEAYIYEDAAQALGSKYEDGSLVGNCKNTNGCMFSFSFNKLIAAGQGGMLTFANKAARDEVKYMSLQAKDDPEMYIHNDSGFNVGMSNMNAALAYAQMEEIDIILKKKKRVKEKYLELLGEENMYYQEGGNGWLNAYRSKENYRVVSDRCKAAGIQVRPLFCPNHLQKRFKQHSYFGNNLAEEKYKHTICLPSSTDLTDEEIKYVVKLVRGDK
jgi:perosamine synthetase